VPAQRPQPDFSRGTGSLHPVTATAEDSAPADEIFGDGTSTADSNGDRSNVRDILEWVLILGGAVVIAVLVRTFLLQTFYIPSGSMEDTLQINDRVVVNKLSYQLHDVHRGDIVVFKRPPGENDPTVKDLIKRVVAVGGDTVESHGNTIYINDKPVNEPFRKGEALGPPVDRQTIEPGKIWVMGDNRTNSSDSRTFGAIDQNLVVGRAFVRIWPLGSFHLL
jgi:signal peptidase I